MRAATIQRLGRSLSALSRRVVPDPFALALGLTLRVDLQEPLLQRLPLGTLPRVGTDVGYLAQGRYGRGVGRGPEMWRAVRC